MVNASYFLLKEAEGRRKIALTLELPSLIKIKKNFKSWRSLQILLVLSNTLAPGHLALLGHNQHWARGKVNHASSNTIIRSLFSQA